MTLSVPIGEYNSRQASCITLYQCNLDQVPGEVLFFLVESIVFLLSGCF